MFARPGSLQKPIAVLACCVVQVDGLRNPLVQSLYLEDCPIHTAAFAAGGNWVVAAGRRPFYYVADLNTGGWLELTACC